MSIRNALYAGVALMITSLPCTLALPAELQARDPPDCANIETWTVEVFQTSMTRQPDADTCLFYTQRTNGETASLSETAKEYACNQDPKLTTIWDLWPTGGDQDYYNMKGADSWLRCINAVDADRNTYFEHMSEAFALSCSGDVQVMTDDPTNLPTTGIWANVELVTLQGMSGITSLTAIDVTGSNPQEIPLSSNDKRGLEGVGRREDCTWTNPYEPAGEDWFG